MSKKRNIYFNNETFDLLINRVRNNPSDKTAWNSIASDIYKVIDGVIAKIKPSEDFHCVDDLRQDAMLAILEVLPRLETGKNSFSWITQQAFWSIFSDLRRETSRNRRHAKFVYEELEIQRDSIGEGENPPECNW